MSGIRNVLFIMCDQLRADHLSCYGNSILDTPNIDQLARRGVRFDRAFVQSAVCGPSRMSFYTGRYPSSHGAGWNFIPMSLGELTLGDYLDEHGIDLSLIGKTHFEPLASAPHYASLGLRSSDSLLEGGFKVVARHEGDLPRGKQAYRQYLHSQGYRDEDPWLQRANSGVGADGMLRSGWHMHNAHLAANIEERHSETAYAAALARTFIEANRDVSWVLHLSFIKPHWPYIAPAPYHEMYRHREQLPILRRAQPDSQEHPVLRAYRTHDECLSFSREEVARHIRPTYMGLVKQIDDHVGRVLDTLQSTGQLDSTLILFTSDHGDFLGDYGLGEKELFYDVVQRIPFIVVDPRVHADATRGTTCSEFVEAVDVVPTILDMLGKPVPWHRVEGRSLRPLLHGEPAAGWRDCVFSEIDYSTRRARLQLGLDVSAPCKGHMIRTDRWKLVQWAGFRPQLYDLQADPQEVQDLGAESGYETVVAALTQRLLAHMQGLKSRTGVDHARIESMTDRLPPGIFVGAW